MVSIRKDPQVVNEVMKETISLQFLYVVYQLKDYPLQTWEKMSPKKLTTHCLLKTNTHPLQPVGHVIQSNTMSDLYDSTLILSLAQHI